MPEPVFYMRGFPMPVADRLAASTDMLEDLQVAARLTETDLKALRQRLSEAKGFLDTSALLSAIREVVGSEESASSVQRILRNLGPTDVEKLLAALAESVEEEDFPLDAETLAKLRHVLPALIQPYAALQRFEKAERLAKITGHELEAIDLICDLRPIFDETRERLDGLMPYTRLRVVVTGPDGLPKSFDAELTHQQVHELAEKARKALSKLEVLRRMTEDLIPDGLPDLPMTRLPRKEPSDA